LSNQPGNLKVIITPRTPVANDFAVVPSANIRSSWLTYENAEGDRLKKKVKDDISLPLDRLTIKRCYTPVVGRIRLIQRSYNRYNR
jgi:hypothetical protein